MILEKIKIYMLLCENRLGKYLWKSPNVKTIDETLDYIIENKCSVSRFGDGEFAVMLGNENGFQRKDSQLGRRLSDILKGNSEKHIVCIPDVFGDLNYMKSQSKYFFRGILGLERKKWLKLLNLNKIYYNAFFTRCYNLFEDKSSCSRWFEKNKKIWKNQHILLIEGEKSRLGVGNDLFLQVASVQRILCPAKNAYDRYEIILKKAMEYGGGKLILLSLGMTATVLSYDLAQKGLWAIDIGHIDIEYEWFLRGAKDKIKIDGKYVNEVKGGKDNIADCEDTLYESQIICKIV